MLLNVLDFYFIFENILTTLKAKWPLNISYSYMLWDYRLCLFLCFTNLVYCPLHVDKDKMKQVN